MVNVQSMRMVWAVALVMVVVVSVNFQQVAAKKAKKDPASYGLPPAASSDCDGVAVGMGGATKVADPNDCTKYSLCLTSFGFKLDCPEGKHFSAVEGFCTSPEKAGCDPAFATAAPAAPAAEDATEEAAGEVAETKLQTEANLYTAEQAEEAADEVPEVAGEAGQTVEDVQNSADEVVAEV